MPVHNAAPYLAAAIESILRQTYTDFEFLIIDDGSTDGSPAILQAATRDQRVRVIRRENRGLVATLNEGLTLARAPLIARMDADDVARPARLAQQVGALAARPEVLCLGGAFELIDGAGRRIAQRFPPTEDAEIQEYNLRGHNAIAHPTALYRRAAVQAVGGYRERFKCAEDLDLWLRLGETGVLANLRDVVLSYRLHGASVSQNGRELQRERMAAACREACARRGVQRPFEMRDWRPGPTRDAQFDFTMDYGWSAYMLGERRTAAIYGAKAARTYPWRAAPWKLVLTALLKPHPA